MKPVLLRLKDGDAYGLTLDNNKFETIFTISIPGRNSNRIEEIMNAKHRKKVNKEAIAGFVALKYTQEEAEALVVYIAGKAIKHVTINY